MKAVAGNLPINDDGWAYEVKWDGYRTIAWVAGGSLMLQSSNLIDVTSKWPSLGELAQHVNADSAVLDGEVACFDENGRTRFEWLQQGTKPVTFVIFDVLGINGHETMGLPYEQRRALLSSLVEPGGPWLIADYVTGPGKGAELAEFTRAAGAEGIVAKRLDSTYVPGKRATTWRKIKHRHEQEFVIGGYTTGTGARSTSFGSLALGYYVGDELRFAGTAGSGLDHTMIDKLLRWMKSHPASCPFTPPPPREVVRESVWCEPLLVAQCAFTEWTEDGVMRHPVFLGLRDDKDPRQVTNQA
jgi:bifunctional non-homologous end joining protein LigD